MSERPPIEVVADWHGLKAPLSVGWLHRDEVRGEEVLSFEYAGSWLATGQPMLLDPKLHFVSGRQYAPSAESFGLFLDSAPDRWGRLLIQRREAMESGRSRLKLYDTDYLLAVSDFCRVGGLRFRLDSNESFLAKDNPFSVPPLETLRTLEQASLQFESADQDYPKYAEWLRLLLAPGSSLGGARPKSSVIDTDAQLWIAKFPSKSDTYNVGAWEALVYDLAGMAGLQTVDARAERFSSTGHTFLIRRFDRNASGERIHFASAMNLLGYKDGDGASTGASYLELVELIERYGATVDSDLEELWRRVVFNILVGNQDDHLRNHGFLLSPQGWRLSPAYDLNPQPYGCGLALNIDETNNACDLDLARSVGPYFRLSETKQDTIIKDVQAAVSQWQDLARARKISRSEIEMLRPSFNLSL